MAVSLYSTATEYIAVPITLTRGHVTDIVTVGMCLDSNLSNIPGVADFTTVLLVDGTTVPLPDMAITGEIDIMALVGPGAGADFTGLTAGSYQIWILVTTANEQIIRKSDVLTIT